MNSLFPVATRFWPGFELRRPPEAIGGGFSGAIVQRVVCEGGVFALRGWPSGVDPGRIRALHRLLAFVAHRGTPLAVPVPGRSGESLLLHEDRWWQIEPWLPGRADFHDSPTERRLAAAMRVLAAFHIVAASYPPDHEWFDASSVGTAPAVRDRLAILHRYAAGELTAIGGAHAADKDGEFPVLARAILAHFHRLAAAIGADLRFAAGFEVPLLPCLRDVWHDHVLFTGDEVTGLIDPAACRPDTVAADLARLLGSLIGDDPVRWTTAISLYVSHRPLSGAEVVLIPILDRSGLLLSAMNWLRRRYLLAQPCVTPPVLTRLRTAVDRLESLRG